MLDDEGRLQASLADRRGLDWLARGDPTLVDQLIEKTRCLHGRITRRRYRVNSAQYTFIKVENTATGIAK